jgi:hypothetical protein
MADYQNQWRQYRGRRRWLVVLVIAEFLAFFPAVAAATALSRRFPGKELDILAFFILGPIFAYTATRLNVFPCPRCGKNFFAELGDLTALFRPGTALGRECVHCGLRKYPDV